MPPVRRILILCLLVGLLILGWMNWRDVSSRPKPGQTAVPAIIKQPVNFASRTFDPASPPPDMPPLNPGENAECDSNFLSNANIDGLTRQTDATHGTVIITGIKVT